MSDAFALRLSHEIVVPRPIGPVFDVATAARHWTRWHPATLLVEGQTERPARLGDRITEYVRIANHEGHGTWTVQECEPPHRLVLVRPDAGIGHVRIEYRLEEVAAGTRFVRILELPPLSAAVEAAMHTQSAAGLTALAALLQREIPGPDRAG